MWMMATAAEREEQGHEGMRKEEVEEGEEDEAEEAEEAEEEWQGERNEAGENGEDGNEEGGELEDYEALGLGLGLGLGMGMGDEKEGEEDEFYVYGAEESGRNGKELEYEGEVKQEGVAGVGEEEEEEEEKRETKSLKKELLSTMPLIFADKVNTSKMIIECDDDNLDLSGDIGSIGRVCFKKSEKIDQQRNIANLKLKQSQMKNRASDGDDLSLYLDLKGITYKADIVPSNSLFIVNLSNSQAKVETLANSFVQLTEEQNFNDMETMLQGNLDGYFLASDDENNQTTNEKENTENQKTSDDNNNNIAPNESKVEPIAGNNKPKSRKRTNSASEGKIKPTKSKPVKRKSTKKSKN